MAGFSDKFYLSIIDLLIDKAPLKLSGEDAPEEQENDAEDAGKDELGTNTNIDKEAVEGEPKGE